MSTRVIESFTGEHRFLSNFFICQAHVVCSHRLSYYAVENAYQASKSHYVGDRRKIQTLTPARAKIAGREVVLREDWEQVKGAVMADFLLQKFLNNEDCRGWLLETGDVPLVHGNFHGDVVWGVVNGVGKNRLGKLLMFVRRLLQCV
jgi:ribA/ribD-fused uncharacterized protein